MQKIIQNRALQAANAQLSVQVGAAVVEQVKEAVEHAKGSSIGAIEEENIYGEAKKGLENGDLPVPPQNIQTTNVEEVYSLSDIVSAEELSVIHVKLLLRAPDERSRVTYLPFKEDTYNYGE